jgi:hypothetical protein
VVCFVRVFSTHQHGIFPITHGNHTERERERRRRRREHPCRGVSILCSTCGIVQLHSIVAPPSTTTGVVGLSNINHHLADFKAEEEEEEEAKSAFLSRRSATKASTSFCKLCSFWTNHSAVNAPATANPAWSCGSVVGSSVGVRSRRRIVSPAERERERHQKHNKRAGFISPTKTTTMKTMRKTYGETEALSAKRTRTSANTRRRKRRRKLPKT